MLAGCASFPDDFGDLKQDVTHPKRLLQNVPVTPNRSAPLEHAQSAVTV
jgi:hypothetical protein